MFKFFFFSLLVFVSFPLVAMNAEDSDVERVELNNQFSAGNEISFLQNAIAVKDPRRIRWAEIFLDEGMNIDSTKKVTFGGEETLLMAAVKYHDLEMCTFLIDHGARVNFQDSMGINAFHYLVFWAETFPVYRKEFSNENERKRNEMHERKKFKKIVKLFFSQCSDLNVLDARDKNNVSPLMWAHIFGNKYLIKTLKNNGATINFKQRMLCFVRYPFRKAPYSRPSSIRWI